MTLHSPPPTRHLPVYCVTLPQSEYGDIYKATLQHSGDAVTCLTVKYFDTLPPAASLAVLKTGFLFVASEFGNHSLYQFIVSGCDGGVGVESAVLCLRAGKIAIQPPPLLTRPSPRPSLHLGHRRGRGRR
jgi:splicing factor 3B subunit 3